VEVLVEKTIAAAKAAKVSRIVLAGGVAANSRLREFSRIRGQKENLSVFLPPPEYCTDNAAMIAIAGFHLYQNKNQQISSIDMDVYSRSQIHF
jgi:N6-L-threonylcarbamoyladenine synthase